MAAAARVGGVGPGAPVAAVGGSVMADLAAAARGAPAFAKDEVLIPRGCSTTGWTAGTARGCGMLAVE